MPFVDHRINIDKDNAALPIKSVVLEQLSALFVHSE